MMRRGGETIAWFNCSAGVAGDMVLGALVDAGADPDEVAAAVAGLGLDGYALTFERVQRCGVRATWANVVVYGHGHDDGHDEHDRHGHDDGHHEHDHDDGHDDDGHGHGHGHEHHHEHEHHDHGHGHEHHDHDHESGHPHRPAGEVLALIEGADLPDRVRARATAVYRALAEVEGEIHGIPADEVELHEVGATDAIIDVVGACAALESLGIDRIVCGPLAVGSGTVRAAHGTLPNPAPAVVRLLARREAPARGIDTPMELATPTGVALVTTLADRFGPLPEIAVRSVGFGAGTADPPGRPNVVNVVVGRSLHDEATGRPGSGRPARLVEANVDDATPEVLAHTVTRLLQVGAHDAWITPIVMKKGRPAHTVSALCDDGALAAVTRLLVDETGTLGVRASVVERWPQQRHDAVVEIDGHPVRLKLVDAPGGGAPRVKVEHDDAVAAAAALGLPLRVVMDRAARAATPDGADPGP